MIELNIIELIVSSPICYSTFISNLEVMSFMVDFDHNAYIHLIHTRQRSFPIDFLFVSNA